MQTDPRRLPPIGVLSGHGDDGDRPVGSPGPSEPANGERRAPRTGDASPPSCGKKGNTALVESAGLTLRHGSTSGRRWAASRVVPRAWARPGGSSSQRRTINERATTISRRTGECRLSCTRARHPRPVGRHSSLRNVRRDATAVERIYVLRRATLPDRQPPLRQPPGRHPEGHRAPLLDHARPPRGTTVRVGHPRVAGGDGRPEATGPQQPRRDRGGRHRRLQRSVPHAGNGQHRDVGDDHAPDRALGGFRKRLQDDGHRFHGVRLVGVQGAVGQGPRVPRFQGPSVLLWSDDAAVQFRSEYGLSRCRRSVDHRAARDRCRFGSCRRRRLSAHLDDDTVDPPLQTLR